MQQLIAILLVSGILAACGGSQTTVAPVSKSSIPLAATATATAVATAETKLSVASSQLMISPTQSGSDQSQQFWNAPFQLPAGLMSVPDCDGDFGFTHRLVDLDEEFDLFFTPGWHVAPHDHMVYWLTGRLGHEDDSPTPGSQFSRRVQIFAPADIYALTVTRWKLSSPVGRVYNEWSAYFTTCDEHQLVFHHVNASDEILNLLDDTSPSCAESTKEALASGNTDECRWRAAVSIRAGTPLLWSSGYSAGFDFGLMLYGVTAEELQTQPGYGYAMNPWQPTSGNAVCPLEYFPEPHRSEYLKVLGMGCGLFNQDVLGTAMGFWLSSPTSEDVRPIGQRIPDENQTLWLFTTDATPSTHRMTVGTRVPGLERGQYRFVYQDSGLVNRRWDEVVSGDVYCVALQRQTSFHTFDEVSRAALLVEVGPDGMAMTVEAIAGGKCDGQDFSFSGAEQIFYR